MRKKRIHKFTRSILINRIVNAKYVHCTIKILDNITFYNRFV